VRPASVRTRLHANPLLLAVVSLAFLSSAWAATGEKRITCQGRVVSEGGEALAGWPVSLIGTSRYVEIGKHTSGGDVATIVGVVTDENGYYAIDIPRQRRYHFYFLRFVDPATLDTVKYRVPADVEITAEARRNRVAAVDVTIGMNPDWPEVQSRIARAGGVETPKGKILRTLGLPEKSVTDGDSGEEEWWYFTKGILYTFRGAEPVGTRHFEPVAAPKNGGAGPAGEGR